MFISGKQLGVQININNMHYIQQICSEIVNPPKISYTTFDLGHIILSNGRRDDFQVKNNQNQILKCSIYTPKHPHLENLCAIYLHSMNGSRLQCLSYIDHILAIGIFVCTFDFRGCGISESSSISFGANEKYDIHAVIEQLVEMGMNKIMLWGRSMGAVASLKYIELWSNFFEFHTYRGINIEIVGCILDSPFSSLKQIILEIGRSKSRFPKIAISAGYHLIKGTLEKKGGFEIADLELVESVKNIRYEIPMIFLASKQDSTISYKHSELLYEHYHCKDKRLIYINGMHNESRDQQYLRLVQNFMRDQLVALSGNRNHKKINILNSKTDKLIRDKETINCTCSIFNNNTY